MKNIRVKNADLAFDFRGPKVLVIISWLALAISILFKLSAYPVSQFNLELIFVLAFLGGLVFRPWQLKFDVAIHLIALSVLLPLLFFVINYLEDPSLAMEYFVFEKLVRLMAFSAIGFWLGGKLRNIYVFLSLVFLGLIIALLNVDTLPAFKNIFRGGRVDFGISNAQHTAMFFGLAIIGFISFYKELLLFLEHKKFKIVLITLFSAALLLAIIIFVGSQTRVALIGMNFLFILSIIHFLLSFKKHSTPKKVVYLFCVYAFLSSIVLSLSTAHTLNKRGYDILLSFITPSTPTINTREPEVLSPSIVTPTSTINTHETEKSVAKELPSSNLTFNIDLNNIPMSSLGIRINTWIEASKWIREKPLHGWGGKAAEQVILQSNFPDNIKKAFGHFHNSYIEFTLAYGLIGLIFILLIYSWVNRQIYLLAKENAKYQGIWLFTLYGSLYLMVINISESYVFFSTGAYATAFLLAPAYSLYLSKLYNQIKKEPKTE